MADENRTFDASPPLDERGVARKFGIRELSYPDRDQVLTLSTFLASSLENGKCSAIPKTAVLVALEFLQATITRQHITKGPRMSPAEFDTLQTPYYVAARIIAKLQRARQDATRQQLYQSTWVSLGRFAELLRNLLDPSCPWPRSRSLPADVRESMAALHEFLSLWPEQKKKGRAT